MLLMCKALALDHHCPKRGTVQVCYTCQVVTVSHSIYLDAELAPENNENNYYIAKMRAWRDHLLKQSDWSQATASPLTDSKKTEWATYRQTLRDFPASWTPADTADFPDQPS